jgi:putative CocE/NonD family hydrolase
MSVGGIRAGLALIISVSVSGTAWAQEYEVLAQRSIMMPMRDGINLATDLYLPARDGRAADGKFPAILVRTPYGKATEAARLGDSLFARHGYVVVYQDTRGRFESDGVWHMMTDDGRDGQDACNWIGRQAWSNGSVGMMGISYVGGTQHAVAMEGCPFLKTVVPIDAVSNPGHQSMRNGGAFELRFFNWPMYGAAIGSRQSRNAGLKAILDTMFANRRLYLANLPIRRGTTPLKFAPEYEDWLVEAMQRPGGDPFWKQNDIIDYPDRYQDIPVYLVGGWYDSWAGNTSRNYQILSRRLKSPVYLIFGPWIHGMQGSSAHGQVNFGAEAAIANTQTWHLAWFDRFLKGVDNAVGKREPFATKVRIFVMGTGDGHRDEKGRLIHGGYWRDEREWPLARARPTNFYLGQGGELRRTPPTGAKSSTTFEYDPANPVPTIGGNISFGQGLMQQGARDQRGGKEIWNAPDPIPLSARRDVLVFQSEPLAEDLEVTGEITVNLWISSDGLDTYFTAKLIDVYPSSSDWPGGFDLNLEDGIIRARFRKSIVTETLLTPGAVEPVTIRLYPTSNVFKKGHRIRLDISSSNFPRFDLNPNTGEPLGRQRRSRVATNTVWHDGSHPSHVVLPVVPATR